MKTVILCGGRGTRLDEMGKLVPKALVPIGGKPVIWHLMRIFTSQGFSEFTLCLGYLGQKIEQYFGEISDGSKESLRIDRDGLKCRIKLVDTGPDTNTGGRLKAVQTSVSGDENFFVTYGDGLSDVDLNRLADFHGSHGKTATLTAVHPVSNFGMLELDADGSVQHFREKPVLREWINGGFFVFQKEIFDHLDDDPVLEQEPLESLARTGELMAYRHSGFWKCMDTYKDNLEMNVLWDSQAPWKTWPEDHE
ncbi:MAG TPA: sugar phosphate nucleotidyltransferase [Pyrinomonadaceae bacterium]